MPTAPLRLLPDFMILGAAKCGTTMLFHSIASHPDVRWALRKEVRFFDQTYHRGLNWYRAFFPLRSEKRRWTAAGQRRFMVGEGTPDYLFHPHAPERARSVVSGAKLLVILRNPVDRAYSHYRQHLRRGFEKVSFERALEREHLAQGELERMRSNPRYHSFERQHRSYVGRGHYAEQIEWWLSVFPRDQLLILILEDFELHAARELERVGEFLGLDPDGLGAPRRLNTGIDLGPMQAATRQRLVETFRAQNDRLALLLGRDPGWDR